jgi:hypothetical protein
VPGIMGFFFGVGHFIAFYFFDSDIFKKAEKRVNNAINELF